MAKGWPSAGVRQRHVGKESHVPYRLASPTADRTHLHTGTIQDAHHRAADRRDLHVQRCRGSPEGHPAIELLDHRVRAVGTGPARSGVTRCTMSGSAVIQ